MTTHGFREDFNKKNQGRKRKRKKRKRKRTIRTKIFQTKGKDESYWTQDEWQGHDNENKNEGCWA